ncbi:universal stress protein [Nonomuraea wenchangensis]
MSCPARHRRDRTPLPGSLHRGSLRPPTAGKPRRPPGGAAEAIVDVAEEIDASSIVLGSRGRRGLSALLSGSTSTRVMHSTSRSTLIIPSGPLAAARPRCHT